MPSRPSFTRRHISRLRVSRLRLSGRRMLRASLVALGLFAGTRSAFGQETLTGVFDPRTNTYYWIRHLEGRQIGDVSSFTSAGGTRYGWRDNGALLITGQGLMTNNGDGGGNLGATRRLWLTDESILGVGLWGDLTTSRNENVFQQGGLSFEVLGDLWSLRANWYQPLGPRLRNVSYFGTGTPGGLSFVGSHLVSGQIGYSHDEIAMGGVDVDVARSISDYSAEAFVGYYNLQGPIGKQANGIKGGLRGYLTTSVAATATVGYDDVFGTNVFGGFTWFFGSGGSAPQTLDDKLIIPVQRNEQIAVRDVGTYHDDYVTLTNRGTAIKVAHVDSQAAAGDGTAEAPFASLLDAAAATDADVIYVHADSTFIGQSINLQPGQRLLGEGPGILHLVQTDQLGSVGLPRATAGTMLPLIQGSPGAAVVLANGVEVAGLRIANSPLGLSAGAAVTGPVNVHDVSLAGVDRGIDIVGSSGQFDFSRVAIEDAVSSGILIRGGSAETNLQDVRITTTNGPGLVLDNTGPTTISGSDNTIAATGGPALDVTGSELQATFQSLASTNSAAAGLRLAGVLPGSHLSVTGPVLLRNAAGNGLEILSSAGDYAFSNLDIDTTGGAGIVVFGSPDTRVNFGKTLIASAGAEGIVLNSNPGGHFQFDTLSVESFGGHGLFASNSGTVNINDTNTAIAAHGGAAVFLNGTCGETSGTSGWTFDSLLSENSSAEGIALIGLADDFTVLSSSTVRNSASHGIFVFNAEAGRTLTFGGLTAVDGTPAGSSGIAMDQSSADVVFDNIHIQNTGASGVAIGALSSNSGIVRILGGTIENLGTGTGLLVRNSNASVRGLSIEGGNTSMQGVADGGTARLWVADSRLLNATGVGVRLESVNGGQLQTRLARNTLDTVGVDSLEATVFGPGSVLCVDADENQAILGAPDGTFHLTQAAGGDLNVTQADAADLSNRNHGVNVGTSGAVDFNQPPCPTP